MCNGILQMTLSVNKLKYLGGWCRLNIENNVYMLGDYKKILTKAYESWWKMGTLLNK